jgi:glycosyltransferase involved in cell wall biosynthesis
MRILYDGRIFQAQKAGGINRYFAEIISGLPADFHPIITGVRDLGKNEPRHPNLVRSRFHFFHPGPVSFRLHALWHKPRLLANVDLVHLTYFDVMMGYSLADFKCPVVVTAHDFLYHRYPKLMNGAEKVIHHQNEGIGRADFIICISKFTENELLKRFPEKAGKTVVIYHGSSFEIQAPVKDAAIFDRPAFLYVGSRAGYKNFSFLLRAFARAAESNPRIRLRVAGAPWNEDERWQIHILGITDKVELVIYPDEQQLLEMYRSSAALVYPSLNEGFGLPPLEAMACRTVVISSDSTSLPEVVGNGGILLDPSRESDWVECILKIAQSGPDRASLIAKGLERVRLFSWKDTVSRHVALYRQLV